MSLQVAKTPFAVAFAMAAWWNNLVADVGAAGAKVHRAKIGTTGGDYTNPTFTASTITTANASDEATTVALANALKAYYNVHIADTHAHKAADATDEDTADATDEASAITLLNALKAKYETHRASTTFHDNADATNTIAAADATDAASAITLANELKTDINAHAANALSVQAFSLVDP